MRTLPARLPALLAFAAALACLAATADARSPPAPPKPAAKIDKHTGVWVEGPGFDITYGKSYEVCAQRCLDNARCLMIEYYRPEKKCNLYDSVRPRLKGGSSFVGTRS